MNSLQITASADRYGHGNTRHASTRMSRAARFADKSDIRPKLNKSRASPHGMHNADSVSTHPAFLDPAATKGNARDHWTWFPGPSDPAEGTLNDGPRKVSPVGEHRDTLSKAPAELLRTGTSARMLLVIFQSRSSRETGAFLRRSRRFSWSDLPPSPKRARQAIAHELEDTPRPRVRLAGPVQFILKLLETWKLERDKAAVLLGFEESDGDRVERILSGSEPLSGRDTKDRIVHLLHVRKTLSALFRNREVENEWLREPRSLLGEQSPMDLLLEGSMENLLLVREYVETMAGR